MQRACFPITAIALAVLALAIAAPAHAGDSPFVGNWKLHNVSNFFEPVYVLFQVEEHAGKPQAKALASAVLGKTVSIEKFQADAKSMRFELHAPNGIYYVRAYLPKGNDKNQLLGSITSNNRIALARMNKTEETELDPKNQPKASADGKAFNAVRLLRDPQEQQAALKEFLEKNGDSPAAYMATQLLLQNLAKLGSPDAELVKAADQYLKIGARYGPEVEKNTLLTVSQMLTRVLKVSPLAVDYARQAEKALVADDSLTHQAAVLKVLASALKKTGQEQAALALEPRIAKIEDPLDTEFLRTAVPFKMEPFKGRTKESTRVAVVELFTGAYCPPCVAADIAFDAALKTYEPKDVLLLQYHTHIPQPDRLTNPDTLARYTYYKKSIRGVPTAFLNGKVTKALGGFTKVQAESSYKTLRQAVEEALETEGATGVVKLTVGRKGDQIDIQGDVADVKDPGESLKLRFVLIEDVVRYPGGNGQRLHHHVVRAMPGGADGFTLKDIPTKPSATVNLLELKKSLDAYMTEFNQGARPFVDDEYPLNIQHLKVVALLQDDETKEILQAVQVDVPQVK